jgi:hypothetical protein
LVFSNTSQNGQQGFQVACLISLEYVPPREGFDTSQKIPIPQRCLVGACQLVDESIVEELDDQQAQIILIKWLN